MNLRRLLSRSISEIYSSRPWINYPKRGLRILMYHAIGTPAFGDHLGLFSISPDRFKTQMKLLADFHKSAVVDFSEQLFDDKNLNFVITFDDGYLDNLTVAAPILLELGFPFTIFISTNFVKTRRPGFLTPSDLRELASLPRAQIGAHGANHIDLTQCNDNTLREELISSRVYLEDLLGIEVSTMSYPYGAVDRRVRNAAHMAGYRRAACSYFEINKKDRDPLLLARTEINSHDEQRVFLQKLRGGWDWYRWRRQDPAWP